jgi:hypothetical protein
MVHAHGSYGARAGIVRVFRKAGRGRQSGEQEGHSQSATDTLRLAAAQPEGCYCICGKVHGVTDCQNNLLVSFEAICLGRINQQPPAYRRLKQKTHICLMKFPSSYNFL